MRVQENDGQEITFEDLNAMMQLAEKWSFERMLHHLVDKQAEGFFQDSFFVDYSDATHVSVRAGVGIQEDLAQVYPESTRRMLYLPAAAVKLVAAADGTNPRKDIVVVKADRVVTLTESRQIKDFVTNVVAPQMIDVRTDWLATVTVVTGTPGVSPAEPAVPSGYVKIAVINVPAITGPTSQGNLVDSRSLMPILENTKIDTSAFVSVPTKAVGTKLKTTLSELDALGTSAAQVLLLYKAIVGSAPGCTHATAAAAIAAVSAGDRIYLTENISLNAALVINKANLEIHAKPGVVISKGSATTGFDVQSGGGGFNFHGGKVSGFSAGGDKAFAFDAAAAYCSVWGVRLANNDTNIDDSLVDVAQFGNIEE